MNDNKKNLILIMIFLSLIILVPLQTLLSKDEVISDERRFLTTRDNLTYEKLEDYTLDQFPFRNSIRKLKTIVELDILKKLDINNTYIYNDYLVKIEYPLNKASLDNYIDKINYIDKTYLKNNKKYLSIIPDKSYFTDLSLKLDYKYLEEEIIKKVNMEYIDIFDKLTLDDYYKSDIHFKNDKLLPLKSYLNTSMNNKNNDVNYTLKTINNFKGSYYSSVPTFSLESINYLTNDLLESLESIDVINNKKAKIYDLERVDNQDKYNIFLSGPVPILKINNDNCSNDKNLLIFRDSFASSLAPLLVNDYKEIVLVDLRYISSKLLGNYIDFTNYDVLFLHSISLINNSNSLK